MGVLGMYVALELEGVKPENLIIAEAMHNTVIDNSSFMRLMYSEGNVSFNGLHIRCPLASMHVERYFHKHRCTFDLGDNKRLIDGLARLEDTILWAANVPSKRRRHGLACQLSGGFVKIFTEGDQVQGGYEILLKISGIWESETEYGITYKFLIANRL